MTPLRLLPTVLVRTIILSVVLLLGVVEVRSCSPAPRTEAERLAGVRAQLAFLRRALRDEDAAARMQRAFPEGACFLATLYALAWANVARASAEGAVRATADEEIRFALGRLGSPTATRPFRDTQVRRGVLWAGQRNLVLAEAVEIEAEERRPAALVAEFHARSRKIADALLAAPTHHLDTYPGACWPADQAAALASLAAHDRLFGTDYARAGAAWTAWTSTHLDATTGLPPGRIRPRNGAALQPARGCGMSWMLALLPRVDPGLSRAMYARYAEHLGVERLGFRLFAEWPQGADGAADADSGPIVWDVGMAATGIGLAAARANGDAARATDILSLAQVFGFPCCSGDGTEKSYLAGEIPLADAFLAWGLSTPMPRDAREDSRGVAGLAADRWPFHALVTAVQAALVAIVVRGIRRGRAARRRGAAAGARG